MKILHTALFLLFVFCAWPAFVYFDVVQARNAIYCFQLVVLFFSLLNLLEFVLCRLTVKGSVSTPLARIELYKSNYFYSSMVEFYRGSLGLGWRDSPPFWTLVFQNFTLAFLVLAWFFFSYDGNFRVSWVVLSLHMIDGFIYAVALLIDRAINFLKKPY